MSKSASTPQTDKLAPRRLKEAARNLKEIERKISDYVPETQRQAEDVGGGWQQGSRH